MKRNHREVMRERDTELVDAGSGLRLAAGLMDIVPTALRITLNMRI